jgi:CheY-like chemotaxis protein
MTYKILIVDDSKLARMSVAKVLNSLQPGWERLEATNADEALALVRQTPIDVALLDFNMPGRDGISLAEDLLVMAPELPVALISANLQHEVVTRASKIGAQFLSKPLTEAALAAFLSSAAAKLQAATK